MTGCWDQNHSIPELSKVKLTANKVKYTAKGNLAVLSRYIDAHPYVTQCDSAHINRIVCFSKAEPLPADSRDPMTDPAGKMAA